MALNTIKDIITTCNEKYADMTAFRYINGKNIEEKTYAELKAEGEAVSRMLEKFDLIG